MSANPWPLPPPGSWPFPAQYPCVKHGTHADWLQFTWSAKAGVSNLYCLRCFADHLESALPVGGIVVPPATP